MPMPRLKSVPPEQPQPELRTTAGPARKIIRIWHGPEEMPPKDLSGIFWECVCGTRVDEYRYNVHVRLLKGEEVPVACPKCGTVMRVSRRFVDTFTDGQATQIIAGMLRGG